VGVPNAAALGASHARCALLRERLILYCVKKYVYTPA
jgi:hypothetical protein